jgi:hypothetical protein
MVQAGAEGGSTASADEVTRTMPTKQRDSFSKAKRFIQCQARLMQRLSGRLKADAMSGCVFCCPKKCEKKHACEALACVFECVNE